MKKLLFQFILILSFSGPIFADDIGRTPCSEANIDALRGATKPAVARFVNGTRPLISMEIPPQSVGEAWRAKTAGGKSEFLVLLDFSERGFFNRLWVYSCDKAGTLRIQEIEGWQMSDFKRMVRDLEGNGADQLIVPTELDSPAGSWTPTAGTPTWPAVYRFENGRYIEASRDFPTFYDSEILPKLDNEIGKAKNPDREAILTLEKDKILRLLGRDPTAGLKHAYEWMSSGDPQLLQCAVATFRDIGGHDKEMREAQQAIPAAFKKEFAARGGRS